MINIDPITDDCGYAVTLGKLRVDVFPAGVGDTVDGEFVAISEPELSPSDARKFAMLLLAAADFAEGLKG